jgi:hypothetical protein
MKHRIRNKSFTKKRSRAFLLTQYWRQAHKRDIIHELVKKESYAIYKFSTGEILQC